MISAELTARAFNACKYKLAEKAHQLSLINFRTVFDTSKTNESLLGEDEPGEQTELLSSPTALCGGTDKIPMSLLR